jgi:hypothetical protein
MSERADVKLSMRCGIRLSGIPPCNCRRTTAGPCGDPEVGGGMRRAARLTWACSDIPLTPLSYWRPLAKSGMFSADSPLTTWPIGCGQRWLATNESMCRPYRQKNTILIPVWETSRDPSTPGLSSLRATDLMDPSPQGLIRNGDNRP